MKLKATKTSMYQLCKTYLPDMPSMKNVHFNKTPRTTSWWMGFYSQQDYTKHVMYLSPCMGKALLRDEWEEENIEHPWDETTKKHIVHTLTIDQLRSLNMIQD